MGIVVPFPRHARASAVAGSGRGTSAGHGTSGQFSENHRITSSYFRAVKVVPFSSKRSKKRQSPAASRPTVAKVTERPSPYAEAQASKLERNSVSMAAHASRKIPTTQEISVGNFRLAEISDTSDKSAMPTVDQIRKIIRDAMAEAGEGPVYVSERLGLERNYLSDFLRGRKSSLGAEILMLLSRRYNIPFEDLLLTKKKRATA